jgi:hypothetical protein
MFTPKTERVKRFSQLYGARITELEALFDKPTRHYIDFANIDKRLGWSIEFAELKALLDSFDTISGTTVYYGTADNRGSEGFISRIKKTGFNVITKPVKVMRIPINASSIPETSADLLKEFIDLSLLKLLKLETITYLNQQLSDLNKQNITSIEKRKCNFDVEIGVDMLIDHRDHNCECFCLWSADSDFASTVEHLLAKKRKVVCFSAGGTVSRELNDLTSKGLLIYDPKKLKQLIERVNNPAPPQKAKEAPKSLLASKPGVRNQ